jgi:hypothetical protein
VVVATACGSDEDESIGCNNTGSLMTVRLDRLPAKERGWVVKLANCETEEHPKAVAWILSLAGMTLSGRRILSVTVSPDWMSRTTSLRNSVNVAINASRGKATVTIGGLGMFGSGDRCAFAEIPLVEISRQSVTITNEPRE